jgi:hypothetical protein
MGSSSVTKDQWVEMFRAIGLDEAAMRRWHQEFERRHPEGHAGFLRWLGLGENEISAIRQHSRG